MRHRGGVERLGIGAISKLNPKIKRSVDSEHSLGSRRWNGGEWGCQQLGCSLLIHKQRHVTADHAALASDWSETIKAAFVHQNQSEVSPLNRSLTSKFAINSL